MAGSYSTTTTDRVEHYPQIEDDPGRVAELFRDTRWHGLDDFWRPWHRQAEKNIRMVAGRHWEIYFDLLGQFVDITEVMTDEEKAWRQRPVFNWIGYWYQITHAKLIENPPIVSFQPRTADRKDALLAEVMDPIFKYLWDAAGMNEKHDVLMRWMCVTGRAILESFWDPDAGDVKPMIGDAMMAGPDGQPRLQQNVPYNIDPDNPDKGELIPVPGGEPLVMPKGELNGEVLSPLSVRFSNEPVRDREKRWAMKRGVMHVDQVRQLYNLDVEPDVSRDDDNALAELLFGLGHMGAAAESPLKPPGRDITKRSEGFVWTYELWERPRYDVQGLDNVPTEQRHAARQFSGLSSAYHVEPRQIVTLRNAAR